MPNLNEGQNEAYRFFRQFHPPMTSIRHPHPAEVTSPKIARRAAGFSLIELLVVMGVISVMLALGAQVGSGVFRSNTFSGNVAKLSGVLDQARQYAIANNTYVWVAFANEAPSADQPTGRVGIAVVASLDGTKSVGWNETVNVSSPSAQVAPINKVIWLDGAKLDASASASDLPADNRPSETGENLAQGTKFNLRSGGGATAFDRVAVFTPRGEAAVAPSPVAFADIAVRPAIENAGADSKIALIQLNGPTGAQRVYR